MAQQDACTLLDEDHDHVIRLFQSYKDDRDQRRKQHLTQQVCHELMVHTQIEEDVFYPAFADATGDTQLVAQSRREHQQALDLISKIQLDPINEKLMVDLERAVMRHISEERKKMFPEARRAPGLDLMGLAEQLQHRKSELMAGHPA